MEEPAAREERALRREIGFFGSAFLAFNGAVGAGIFALPATLDTQFGDFSPWLFPLFGLLVLTLVLPFARLASLFPQSGGPVAYTAAFGPLVSFQVGWIYYAARVTAFAANSNVFATYAAALWPPLGTGAGRAGVILALCGILTWINIVGVRRAVAALDAVTLLKALPIVGVAVAALALAAGEIPPPGPLPPLSGVEAAALLTLYAFVGFENSLIPAGETEAPRRTIPRALVATLVATAFLYFLVQLAYVAVRPAAGETPLVALGAAVAGPAGGLALTLAALFSIAGNATGSMISTPRVTYALGRDGLLPGWFARVSPRWATPANSILFMGAAAAALALSGSFVWLAVASTLARLFVYAACLAALPAAERRAGGRAALAWAGVLVGLLVCIWAAAQSEWPAWRLLLGLLA
ncbi:MAG: APC family permease, partial [Pseudomonadota bacterium]|nr:APC family permease [Pseudomonadota bacterium]